MHNQSDVSFQSLITIEANKILKEDEMKSHKRKSKNSKYNNKYASSLAEAGDTPLIRNTREQALTGGSRPSAHYFPSATTSTKE